MAYFSVSTSATRCYTSLVITRAIREFVSRDWDAARESKDQYWGQRIARLGPLEGFRIADQLRRQAIRRSPGWPDAALQHTDLMFHVRLAELFRRAGSTRRA